MDPAGEHLVCSDGMMPQPYFSLTFFIAFVFLYLLIKTQSDQYPLPYPPSNPSYYSFPGAPSMFPFHSHSPA